MQTVTIDGKMASVINGWLLCPVCEGSKVLRVYPETSGTMIQVFCKRCRKESIVNIDKCQCRVCQCR